MKTHSDTFYFTGKHAKNKWKHLRDNFRAELNRINANKSGDSGLSPSKRESQWRWFKMLLFFQVLRMLEKWKATYNFNPSNLIGSQQIRK
jgi:hypothetical protein